jgi:hypothetical protein
VTAPHGLGDTAQLYSAVGALCAIFKDNPGLHANSITIRENGHLDVAANGTNGVLMHWCRALPEHRMRQGLVPTGYGADEADVIEAAGITVTIRRPLIGPGGVA